MKNRLKIPEYESGYVDFIFPVRFPLVTQETVCDSSYPNHKTRQYYIHLLSKRIVSDLKTMMDTSKKR